MAEKLSILWQEASYSPDNRKPNKNVIADLQLDRAFRTICPEFMYRDAFLDVVSERFCSIDEVIMRQELFQTFRKNENLCYELTELVRKINVTKNSWDSERSRLYSSRRTDPTDKSSALWKARENLILTAHFVRIMMNTVRSIADLIGEARVSCKALNDLRDASLLLSSGTDAAFISEFCDKIEKGLANAFSYATEFHLTDDMHSSTPFMSDFAYINIGAKAVRQKSALAILFGRKDEHAADVNIEKTDTDISVKLENVDVEWGFDISSRAVQETDRYLTSFLRALIDKYSGLENELYFCNAALMYIERLTARGLKPVYPELLRSEENLIEIEELYDLILTVESLKIISVVPNDVSFRGGGILITGKNNSGKTVYLRSVGTAVLLSQCGLPVPAKNAVISIRTGIFTSFSKSEGELVPDNSAGRFEEEVSEMRGIIDRVKPYSLVLLNETFQTTSYDEGADGMYDILNYLTGCGCGYLFVTHLTKLKQMYKESKSTIIMRTSEARSTQYKVFVEKE